MNNDAKLLEMEAAENDWRPASGEPELPGRRPHRLPGATSVPASDAQGANADKVDWLRAWQTIKKHWRLSAAFAASVMISVALVTALTKPMYAPKARVEIDPPGAELFSLDDRGRSEEGAYYIETQARNMQSDELLISVIRQLRLGSNSEFTQSGFVTRSIGAAFSAMEKVPLWLWGKKKQEKAAPTNPDLLVLNSSEARALGRMQQQLTVERDTASRLVTVSFASHDPVLSATVTNAIVYSFIDHSYQTRHQAIVQSTEWLSRQLDDIRAKMEDSNRALANFQRASGIADVDEYRSTFTEQLAELSRQKTQAQADRIQIESFLKRSKDVDLRTLPQIQNNQVVQMLTQRLGDVRAQLAQSRAIYGKKHPNAKKLQNEVEELESQIKLQRNAIVGEMETRYAAALSREQLLNDQLRGTSRELGQMAEYTALKKEAQTNANLYNALYSRVKEAGIAAASKSINIRVVDQARVLNAPTRPEPLVNIGLGLCVALIGGFLLPFIREAFDHRIHTIQDVRKSVGISSVSMLPLAEGNGGVIQGSLSSILRRNHQGQHRDCPINYLLEEPSSEQSEALRGIHTSLMLSQRDNPPHVLLVVSSIPGEGKTTVAINLAVALVRQGKTCIVDADLRRPSVGRAFKVSPSVGLGDYLTHSTLLHSILTPAPQIEGLTIIAGGNTVTNPGELTNSGDMRLLIRHLREMYDFIIIDSPPILHYSDGRALATLVDGVVFVGRAGMITREAMARSMELLHEVHSAPVIEVVLNGTNSRDTSYGYGYGYNSYPTHY